MKEKIFESLIIEAHKIGKYFSDPNRPNNLNKEVFEIEQVIPLSEDLGAVIYLKSSKLQALCIFAYQHKSGKWLNFFPTDSHILGFTRISDLKAQLEIQNGLKRNINIGGR